MIEGTITRLARVLKTADVDYDTALNVSLRLRRPEKAEELISWLEQNSAATPEEISDKSAELAMKRMEGEFKNAPHKNREAFDTRPESL